MAHPVFQIKKTKNDQFYFVLTAKNGQVIAQSEMFNSKSLCQATIEQVRYTSEEAEIDDQTGDRYGYSSAP